MEKINPLMIGDVIICNRYGSFNKHVDEYCEIYPTESIECFLLRKIDYDSKKIMVEMFEFDGSYSRRADKSTIQLYDKINCTYSPNPTEFYTDDEIVKRFKEVDSSKLNLNKGFSGILAHRYWTNISYKRRTQLAREKEMLPIQIAERKKRLKQQKEFIKKVRVIT